MRRGRLREALVALACLVAFAGVATAGEATEFTGSKEAMRYQHLWMAYAFIWLLVFGLVWRTWRKQQGAAAEIEDLKKRLAALEERDGS